MCKKRLMGCEIFGFYFYAPVMFFLGNAGRRGRRGIGSGMGRKEKGGEGNWVRDLGIMGRIGGMGWEKGNVLAGK